MVSSCLLMSGSLPAFVLHVFLPSQRRHCKGWHFFLAGRIQSFPFLVPHYFYVTIVFSNIWLLELHGSYRHGQPVSLHCRTQISPKRFHWCMSMAYSSQFRCKRFVRCLTPSGKRLFQLVFLHKFFSQSVFFSSPLLFLSTCCPLSHRCVLSIAISLFCLFLLCHPPFYLFSYSSVVSSSFIEIPSLDISIPVCHFPFKILGQYPCLWTLCQNGWNAKIANPSRGITTVSWHGSVVILFSWFFIKYVILNPTFRSFLHSTISHRCALDLMWQWLLCSFVALVKM